MPVAQRNTKTKKASTAKKMERIDARIRSDQKERIERAAHIRGVSVSDFIVQNAIEAASRTIEEQDTWVLRGRDAVAFLEMLENPPAPGPRLKAAFKRFAEEKTLRERKAS